ncbi:hypothetical protein [Paludibacter sp.]|uniref:WD40/YVTN/BNR-like repeat-containing protein n=1 Tax=Paludibacter sp. TaxID=1898105 RepID=UPI001353A92F|nr:hypothetical protein [Paludibacter sp.]MTK54475.1 hypothetical protein [Paludibacter sp.]
MTLRNLFFIACSLFFVHCTVSVAANNAEPSRQKGYNAAVAYADGFVVAGTEGKIDRLSRSGAVVKSEKFAGVEFNALVVHDQTIVAAGEMGALLISSNNGEFKPIDSGTDKTIHSLAFFSDKIIGGTDQGEIVAETGNGTFHKIPLALKGNIVSLSANVSECYGVTDAGEIIRSKDGIQWTITDFNTQYAGYYKPCVFTRVLAVDGRIAIAGKRNDGSPVLFFSTQGNVWTDRILDYTNDERQMNSPTEILNDIYYYYPEDLYFLACNNGIMMQIPSCSHCNKLIPIGTDDLRCMAFNGNVLLFAGSNYSIKAVDM